MGKRKDEKNVCLEKRELCCRCGRAHVFRGDVKKVKVKVVSTVSDLH